MREDNTTAKGETFNLMAALGVSRAEVQFSGGNDEGYIDGITLWTVGGQPRPPSKDVPREKELANLLERPVWDQYGSFAGEFYVNGTVYWDREKRTVKMSGEEEDRNWVPMEQEF